MEEDTLFVQVDIFYHVMIIWCILEDPSYYSYKLVPSPDKLRACINKRMIKKNNFVIIRQGN